MKDSKELDLNDPKYMSDTARYSLNTTGKIQPVSTSRKPVLAAVRELYNISNGSKRYKNKSYHKYVVNLFIK